MADDESIWIESTRGPDDEPACLITWGPIQAYPTVAAVRETALDLVTCAAYAEMMMTLVATLELPGSTASAFVTDLLDGRAKRYFGSKETVTMLPAGSTKTGAAYVLLHRGSQRGDLTPAEARTMALQWLAAAEATESDQLISEALRSAGVDKGRQARVFGYLRALRPEDVKGRGAG